VVIDYTADVVSVSVKPSPGALTQNRLFEANHSESGIIRLGLAGSEPLTNNGKMALNPFVAVGQPEAKTQLKVSVTNANSVSGEKLTPAVIDGEIEIVSSGGYGNWSGQLDAHRTRAISRSEMAPWSARDRPAIHPGH